MIYVNFTVCSTENLNTDWYFLQIGVLSLLGSFLHGSVQTQKSRPSAGTQRRQVLFKFEPFETGLYFHSGIGELLWGLPALVGLGGLFCYNFPQALTQELNFSAYLGLPVFMIPLTGPHNANLARLLLSHIHTGHHTSNVRHGMAFAP